MLGNSDPHHDRSNHVPLHDRALHSLTPSADFRVPEITIPLSPVFSLRLTGSRVSGVEYNIEGNEPQVIPVPFRLRERTQFQQLGATVTLEDSWRSALHPRHRWADPVVLHGDGFGQRSHIITIGDTSGTHAAVLPRTLRNDATIAVLSWPRQAAQPEIRMWKCSGDRLEALPSQLPTNPPRTLHATQILSHIVEGCKLLRESSIRDGSLVEAAFPPVQRTATLRAGLLPNAQHRVQGWTYLIDGSPTYHTDFSDPASMESIASFIAANLDLCQRVRRGEFSLVSSDFRAEAQILKMLNPHITLAGYNFTFLSGRPAEYAERLRDSSPTLAQLIRETGDSLESFDKNLKEANLDKLSCDWWKLSRLKLGGGPTRLDILIYRSLTRDPEIPEKFEGIPILQVPHPIAPLELAREAAREALQMDLGLDLSTRKVLLVPGLSDDGLFSERLRTLAKIASADPQLVLISPLSQDRLNRICGDAMSSDRVRGIGFREDWGSVLAASDAAVVRGSWGEIIDCIRANITPILCTPGLMDVEGDLQRRLFLQEVLGERAVNLGLLHQSLTRSGVSATLLDRITVSSLGDESAVRSAIETALDSKNSRVIREALRKIPGKGVAAVVTVYDWIAQLGRAPTLAEVHTMEDLIWREQ